MSEEDFPPSKIKAIQQLKQAQQPQQAPVPKAPTVVEEPFSKDVIVGPYEEVKPIAQQAALRTAFDLPKEATDIKVTRTPEGMTVEYKQLAPAPSWKETTLAGEALTEQYVPLTLPWVLSKIGMEDVAKAWTTPQAKAVLHPFGTEEASRKFSAGLIAVPESTYKIVAGIFTGKMEPTAPTFTGSLVNAEERKEFLELGPAFWAGSLFASGLEAIGISKGLEYGYKGIKAITPEIIKQPLYAAKEAVRFSKIAKTLTSAEQTIRTSLPSWKGSSLDVWLIKHSAWYEKQALKQLSMGEVASKMAPERWSLPELKADILSMELANFPRSQLVYIAQAPKTSGKALPTLFIRGSQYAWIYPKSTSMIIREATFTPFVSQTQVTRMGVHPYMPPIARGIIGEESSMLLGSAVSTLVKLKQPERLMPKTTFIETFEREREKLRPQTLLTPLPKQKEREYVIPTVKPRVSPVAIPQVMQIQTPKQETRTAMLSVAAMSTPTRSSFQRNDYLGFPKGSTPSMFGRGSSLTRGSWYFKRHPLPTPREVLGYGFKPQRKRRKGKHHA